MQNAGNETLKVHKFCILHYYFCIILEVIVLHRDVAFKQQTYAPQTRKGDYCEDDSAEGRGYSAEYPRDNVEAEKTDGTPV
jgi:hypothetical protein